MMKINRKLENKTIGIFLTVAVLILLGVGRMEIAKAQAGNGSGAGNQLFCTRDFGNFLANGIDLDGEGFTDYWKDLTVVYSTNYCRFTDISSLLDRIDKARKAIRQAFYVCDTVTSAKAKAEYYQMSAELYYLRNFVSTSGVPNSKASKEEKAQNVVKIDIWTKFREKFVIKAQYFDEKTATDLFAKFEDKYATKIDEYKECQDPNLGNLKQKIIELSKTIDTIKKMGQRFAERTSAVIDKTKSRIQANSGLVGGLFTANSFSDYFQKAVDLRINNESAYTATPWEQLKNGAKSNIPTDLVGQVGQSAVNSATGTAGSSTYSAVSGTGTATSGGMAGAAAPALTYSSVVSDLKQIDKRVELQNADLTYLAEYDLKYRQTSGSGLDTLLVNFQDLQKILLDSYNPIDRIKVCAANILSKQCGG